MDFAYKINKISHLLNKSADILLQEFLQIGFTEFFILFAIKYTPDTSQRDIADFLQVTPASVSLYVKRMEKDNLLSRVKNTRNRRKNTIELTAQGKKLYSQAYRLLESHISELINHIAPPLYTKMMKELDTVIVDLEGIVCNGKKHFNGQQPQ